MVSLFSNEGYAPGLNQYSWTLYPETEPTQLRIYKPNTT
jgi:hypothetical protein